MLCCLLLASGVDAQTKSRRPARHRSAAAQAKKPAQGDLKYGSNDFSLRTIDGTSIRLSSYTGRIVLVTIFSPSCPPCTSEVSGLASAYADFHGRGFDHLGVGLQTSETEMRAFITKYNLHWTFGINDTLPKQLGMVGLPDHYLFGRDGSLLNHYVGYLRSDILRSRLDALLPPKQSPSHSR